MHLNNRQPETSVATHPKPTVFSQKAIINGIFGFNNDLLTNKIVLTIASQI